MQFNPQQYYAGGTVNSQTPSTLPFAAKSTMYDQSQPLVGQTAAYPSMPNGQYPGQYPSHMPSPPQPGYGYPSPMVGGQYPSPMVSGQYSSQPVAGNPFGSVGNDVSFPTPGSSHSVGQYQSQPPQNSYPQSRSNGHDSYPGNGVYFPQQNSAYQPYGQYPMPGNDVPYPQQISQFVHPGGNTCGSYQPSWNGGSGQYPPAGANPCPPDLQQGYKEEYGPTSLNQRPAATCPQQPVAMPASNKEARDPPAKTRATGTGSKSRKNASVQQKPTYYDQTAPGNNAAKTSSSQLNKGVLSLQISLHINK